MQFRNTITLALTAIYFATGTAAVSCAVCASTITFRGLVRTLTFSRQDGGNTVQCDYDTPSIPRFSPTCLYRNVDGVLIFTNTGATLTTLPGACPATLPLVQKSHC